MQTRQVGLRPTSLCFLLAVVPLGLTLCSVAARAVSRRTGRVQTIAAFKATGAGPKGEVAWPRCG
jgi:hypothetical protein